MSQAVTTDDKLVYAVRGPDAVAYHTDPHCKFLHQGNRVVRRVPLSTLVGRDICAFCDGFEHSGPNWQNGQCRHCEAHAGGDDCAFCETFDRIHDVARDALFCPTKPAWRDTV